MVGVIRDQTHERQKIKKGYSFFATAEPPLKKSPGSAFGIYMS